MNSQELPRHNGRQEYHPFVSEKGPHAAQTKFELLCGFGKFEQLLRETGRVEFVVVYRQRNMGSGAGIRKG